MNKMSALTELKKDLQKIASPERQKASLWFFKTGAGQYGEGDRFIGVAVPGQRKIAQCYAALSINDIEKLLYSKIHEHRLVALFILVEQYKKGDQKTKKTLYNFYLRHIKQVNNWDLVDSSAHLIVGDYLINQPRKILYRLAKSNNLWEKRISIIATFAFIRHDDFNDSLEIAKILLTADHDLIHKAVGWMLREVGNRNQPVEEKFLKQYYQKMPRTMLRYAIEKFSKTKREFYMKK